MYISVVRSILNRAETLNLWEKFVVFSFAGKIT